MTPRSPLHLLFCFLVHSTFTVTCLDVILSFIQLGIYLQFSNLWVHVFCQSGKIILSLFKRELMFSMLNVLSFMDFSYMNASQPFLLPGETVSHFARTHYIHVRNLPLPEMLLPLRVSCALKPRLSLPLAVAAPQTLMGFGQSHLFQGPRAKGVENFPGHKVEY